MGIELQSAPQGHHRVGGAHGQCSKTGDVSQSEGALGFAALMSLISCQDPEGTSAPDVTGTPLLPVGSDGALVGTDASAALVALQPMNGALFALPPLPQAFAAGGSQVDGQDVSLGENRVSAPGDTQPVIDLAAGVSYGSPLLLPQGIVHPGSGGVSSVGASATPLAFDSSSGAVSSPMGADTTSPEPDAVRFVQNALRPSGIQANTTGMVTQGGLILPEAVGPAALVPAKGELKIPVDLSASPLSAVQFGTQVPVLVPVQIEQSPIRVPRSAADPSNGWKDAKQMLDSLEPDGQVSTQITAQTSIPTLNEPQVPTAVLKSVGVLNSQLAALADQVRHDSNDLATDRSGAAGLGTVALPVPAFVLALQDAGIRPSERPTKHLSNRYGSGGDGVYGQPVATINTADTLFQVIPTSAAAASTVVAETVSYWASQGVQNASLQLDGFGDQPVEVRISVNGDTAQVDFRTNQPELRQAIEGAASQLKDMLSSQGMQLAGMSIGTSGRGDAQGKGNRPPSEIKKVALVKSEATATTRSRSVNSAVGQSLDLFV